MRRTCNAVSRVIREFSKKFPIYRRANLAGGKLPSGRSDKTLHRWGSWRPNWSILGHNWQPKTEIPADDGNTEQLEAEMMKTKSNRILGVLALALVFFLTWLVVTESRGRAAAGTGDYIEGVVTSSKGPEA